MTASQSQDHVDRHGKNISETCENPLVSFVILSFNQSEFLHEAITGALTQDYQPLEIIISDDHSSDRSLEVINESIADYDGPHKIIVRQNDTNLGLIQHINLVFKVAGGDLIVLAAGDDVSISSRTRVIAEAAADNLDALLFHSCATKIDRKGGMIGVARPTPMALSANLMSMAFSTGLHLGATAAIRRRLIDLFDPISENKTYEDLILGFRAALWNGLHFIDEELVYYRCDTGHSPKTDYYAQSKSERVRYLGLAAATYRQRYIDVAKFEKTIGQLQTKLSRRLESQLEFTLARLSLREDLQRYVFSGLFRKPLIGLRAVLSELMFFVKAKKIEIIKESRTNKFFAGSKKL